MLKESLAGARLISTMTSIQFSFYRNAGILFLPPRLNVIWKIPGILPFLILVKHKTELTVSKKDFAKKLLEENFNQN